MTNDDSWQTVPLKKRKGKSNSNKSFKCHTVTSAEKNTSSEQEQVDQLHQNILNKIKYIVNNRNKNQNFKPVVEMLTKWKGDFEGADLLCYCLGSFDDFVNSKYQLAQLTLLRQFLHFKKSNLQRPEDTDLISDWMESYKIDAEMVQCKIFDPAFTATDKKVLEKFYFQVLNENNECKDVCERPAIFYMIHGVKTLHENLFKSNYESNNLKNVFVIGNDWLREDSGEDSCLKSVEVNCQKIKLGSWLIPEVFAETFVYFLLKTSYE